MRMTLPWFSWFLRGVQPLTVYRYWPSVPPRDLVIVLSPLHHPSFEPIGVADLKWLSFITAFLLAITSARRIGELQAQVGDSECCRFLLDGSVVILCPNPIFLPKVPPDPDSHAVVTLLPEGWADSVHAVPCQSMGRVHRPSRRLKPRNRASAPDSVIWAGPCRSLGCLNGLWTQFGECVCQLSLPRLGLGLLYNHTISEQADS